MIECRPIWFLILAMTVLHLNVNAQVQDILPSGTAPGGAGVAYTRHAVAWGNPAAVAYDTSVTVTVGYENRYFVPELSDEYLTVSVPTPYFSVGAAFKFFGFAGYHEMMAAVAVSRRFGRVTLGVEADYFTMYQLSDKRYRHAVTAQTGLHVDCTERFTVGFRFFNPVFAEIKFYDVPRKLPVVLQLGGEYRFVSRLTLLFQAGYVFSQGFDWAVGAEYDIAGRIAVKAGVRGADYVIPSLGAGIEFGGFGFELLAEADFRIGMSILSFLQYRF